MSWVLEKTDALHKNVFLNLGFVIMKTDRDDWMISYKDETKLYAYMATEELAWDALYVHNEIKYSLKALSLPLLSAMKNSQHSILIFADKTIPSTPRTIATLFCIACKHGLIDGKAVTL